MKLQRVSPKDSPVLEMLIGCTVVLPSGESIGLCKSILIDATTRQLKYIDTGTVVIPWHAMYFDSILCRLVFYTYQEATDAVDQL